MTVGLSQPPSTLTMGGDLVGNVSTDSLIELLKFAGLAGLAGGGLWAAQQTILRDRAAYNWKEPVQNPAQRAEDYTPRPLAPVVASSQPQPQPSPTAAELSDPRFLKPPPAVEAVPRLQNPPPVRIGTPLPSQPRLLPRNNRRVSRGASQQPATTRRPNTQNQRPPTITASRSSTPSQSNQVLPVPPRAVPTASAQSTPVTPNSIQRPTPKPLDLAAFVNPNTVVQPTVPAVVAQVLAPEVSVPEMSPEALPDAQSPIAEASSSRTDNLPELQPGVTSQGVFPFTRDFSTTDLGTAIATDGTNRLTAEAQAQSTSLPFAGESNTLVTLGETDSTGVDADSTEGDAVEEASPAPDLSPVKPSPIGPSSLVTVAEPKRIFVKQFEVAGSTVYAPEELAINARNAVVAGASAEVSDLEEKLGFTDQNDEERSNVTQTQAPQTPIVDQELTVAELVRASEAITARYVKDGYINSGAYVPKAVLEGGPAVIQIEEGRLEPIEDEDVVIEPPKQRFSLGRSLKPGYVKQRLARANEQPFNINQLLDNVRLLEMDPVIERVSTELVPGTETGTSALKVNVLPAKPFGASFSVDNARSPSVGSIQQRVDVTQNNLLGVGDRLNVGFGRSSGSNSLNLGYSIPVNARNGTLSFDFNRSSSRVIEEPFNDLDIESKSRTYELKFRQPIIQRTDEELGVSLTAFRRGSEGFFLDGATPFPARGADEDGRTRVSALRFGQDWIKRQPNQVLSAQSEFSLGLGVLGATVNPEPPDSQFFAWRGRGQWVRHLGGDSLLSVKGDVQLSANPLLPSEQFGLGGAGTVRGYRSNSLLSDSGWLASAEVQVPVLRFPKRNSVVKLAPFFDVGGGWNLGDQENPEPSRLMSTGLGLVFDVGDRFRARLDWGFPLTTIERDGDSLQEKGLNFSLFWNAF